MNAQQKRTADEADSLLDGVKALVVDIEGTTLPIDFVKDTLFQYVKDNIETYLQTKYDDDETKKDIAALVELATKDKEEKVDGVVEIPAPNGSNKDDVIKAVCNNVKWQMDNDRKTTALKDLQGHMWREGYKSGQFKAELFDDVCPVLQRLTDKEEYNIKVYVYSSGSVEAQKLLFANTEDGDIQDLFTDFFDTNIGGKRESASYKKITEIIKCDCDEILYLTDTPEEAEAAGLAGLRCALVARDGNEDLTEKHFQDFLVIESFGELLGDDEEEDLKRLAQEEGDDDEDEEEDLGDEEEEEDPEDDDDEEDPDDDDDA